MDLLTITVGETAGWTVVSARGQVDVATAPRLQQTLQRLAPPQQRRLVLDLGAVEYVDAFGLGVLLEAVTRAHRGGGTVALVCTSARVRGLLDHAGLDRLADVHTSVSAAVADPGTVG